MVIKTLNIHLSKRQTLFSVFRKAVLFFLFSGQRVRCNICGQNFRRFRRDTIQKRENVRCPECGSLESGRVLWFYLTNEVLGKKNKKKFLYFSPEPSLLAKLNKFNIKIDTESLDYLESIQKDGFDKRKGGKYDVILFIHLLQRVSDEQLVFSELLRLLRPGGFVLIMTLINWDMDRTYEKPETEEDRDRLKNYYSPGLVRVYGSDVAKRLVKAGFDVETIDYADQLGDAARDYYRLGDAAREIIFKCKKI
jgi:SAM-dependent methyltransferase